MQNLIQEMRIRNFSPKTIKAYLYYNNELLRFASKFADEINKQDIKDYLDFLFSSGRSSSTVNLAVNALKFYYQNVMARKFFDSVVGVKRPRSEKKLPVVLSKQEVVSMLSATDNRKHKLMIMILYGSGLRLSELADLKINDIDFYRKMITVREGKGAKDRITIISDNVLREVDEYLKEFQPLVYLFESHGMSKKIHVRSIQKVIEHALEKSGIRKPATVHSLRHSFATHLLENGTDIRYIQELLGHARLETTQIYTKVANNMLKNIKSPI